VTTASARTRRNPGIGLLRLYLFTFSLMWNHVVCCLVFRLGKNVPPESQSLPAIFFASATTRHSTGACGQSQDQGKHEPFAFIAWLKSGLSRKTGQPVW